jgi:hypothetical protein
MNCTQAQPGGAATSSRVRSEGGNDSLHVIAQVLRGFRSQLSCEHWFELCLDVLVHSGSADGGALVDADGAVLASVGLQEREAVTVSRWSEGPWSLGPPEMRAWWSPRQNPDGSCLPRLVLWWREPGMALAAGGPESSDAWELVALLRSVWCAC